jgi:hypothetical protein
MDGRRIDKLLVQRIARPAEPDTEI